MKIGGVLALFSRWWIALFNLQARMGVASTRGVGCRLISVTGLDLVNVLWYTLFMDCFGNPDVRQTSACPSCTSATYSTGFNCGTCSLDSLFHFSRQHKMISTAGLLCLRIMQRRSARKMLSLKNGWRTMIISTYVGTRKMSREYETSKRESVVPMLAKLPTPSESLNF